MKKLSLLLALFLGAHFVWAHDVEVDGLFYNLNTADKTASLTFKGDSYNSYDEYSGDIVIPSTVSVDGTTYSVTSLGSECFKGCKGLTSVTILNSVTTLGEDCFGFCDGLTSITIPNSVTSIGNYCFYGCISLTSITIPNSVTSLGNECFNFCSSLERIVVETGNPVYDSRENSNAIIKTATNELVAGCKNSQIPSSVTSLGNYCFSGCTGLTSITIPNTVTSFGGCCFYGCRGLTSITIPSSVTSLGFACFFGCTGLTSIHIPSSVNKIVHSCFGGCDNLESIVVDSNNPVYDSRDNCNAIIRKSTNQLVVGCKTSHIPSSVWELGDYCFDNCRGLTSITIPSSVKKMGNGCFSNCIDLTTLTIPKSVTSVGDDCFYYCPGLTSITMLPITPPTAGKDLFARTPLSTIYVVNNTAKAYYKTRQPWKDYEIVVMPTGIEELEADKADADIVGYYDLSGRELAGNQRGLVIVRYSDGSSRKVVVK